MKFVLFLALFFCLQETIIGIHVFPFNNTVLYRALPKLISKAAMKLQQKQLLSRLNPNSNNSECLDGLLSMITNKNGSLISFILNSFKGFNDIGDYKSCKKAIDTRYILLMIKIAAGVPASGEFGICGPASCKVQDYTDNLKSIIYDFIKDILESTGMANASDIRMRDDSVRFVDVDEYNSSQSSMDPLTAILIFLGIAILIGVLVCTSRFFME